MTLNEHKKHLYCMQCVTTFFRLHISYKKSFTFESRKSGEYFLQQKLET